MEGSMLQRTSVQAVGSRNARYRRRLAFVSTSLSWWFFINQLGVFQVDAINYRMDEDVNFTLRASHARSKELHKGQAGLDVECVMRSIAYDMAMRVPTARRHSDTILESLQASACSDWTSSSTFQQQPIERENEHVQNDDGTSSEERNVAFCCPCQQPTLYVDCEDGSDHPENYGTCVNRPLRTLERAQEKIRQLRASKDFSRRGSVTVYIRDGICHLSRTFFLTESNTSWKAYPNERPIFSGGALLTNLRWSNYTENILVAELPPHVNCSAIDGLFTFPPHPNKKHQSHGDHFGRISTQIRLTRARYPNGNSEVDRMPTNYDKLSGGVSSVDAWIAAGNVSMRYPGIEKRNSSFYPWFGHSNDIRWTQDYHIENASSYYGRQQQFWQPRIATAASFHHNASTSTYSPPNTTFWGKGDAILHVIHYSWWGNWQWEVAGIRHDAQQATNGNDPPRAILEFGKGGWQDAHGGAVSHNYFFIENVLGELDTPGEWFVDKVHRKLYLWPLPEQAKQLDTWDFVATQLPVILHVGGGGKSQYFTMEGVQRRKPPAENIIIEGITFAHSTTTYLKERYTVPSAGDWSVLPKGAVTVRNAINIALESCSWLQVNGNGLALRGMVHNSNIIRGDFVKVGDSAIVSVGRLPKLRPYDGNGADSVPTNVTISQCHFGQSGVYGKQTSALFIALSEGIHFLDNVLYDGPRAGININDGFGGGHRIMRNVIFNQVLESGDHGPINTWSRSAYLQGSLEHNSAPTVIPAWNYIDQNLILLGPKFGSLYGPGSGPCSNGDPQFRCPKSGGSLFHCIDHDDGSEYFLDTRNVCAFAGMKNYIGQNKIWDSNLIVFPEGAKSQNRTGTSCIWTSMDMAGDKDVLPCSSRPCRTQEVFTNNTCLTYGLSPLEYDMFNETDLVVNGIRNTTIPYTARNRYFLEGSYNFQGKWSLTEAQAKDIDVGSTEEKLKDLSLGRIDGMARMLLDLDDPIGYEILEFTNQ